VVVIAVSTKNVSVQVVQSVSVVQTPQLVAHALHELAVASYLNPLAHPVAAHFATSALQSSQLVTVQAVQVNLVAS
jgi:hypothetical protein